MHAGLLHALAACKVDEVDHAMGLQRGDLRAREGGSEGGRGMEGRMGGGRAGSREGVGGQNTGMRVRVDGLAVPTWHESAHRTATAERARDQEIEVKSTSAY